MPDVVKRIPMPPTHALTAEEIVRGQDTDVKCSDLTLYLSGESDNPGCVSAATLHHTYYIRRLIYELVSIFFH